MFELKYPAAWKPIGRIGIHPLTCKGTFIVDARTVMSAGDPAFSYVISQPIKNHLISLDVVHNRMYVVDYRQYDAKHVRSVYFTSKAIPMNKKSWNPKSLSIEQYVQPILERLPIVSFYAKTRGWSFIIAWIHRITGVLLALYFCVHIYTLSFLADPAVYETKMKLFGYFILSFLEWLLAVPVIFHALNGGRLILFEVFGSRNDEPSIRWVLSLTITYVLMLGLMMIRQDQSVSLIIFWLPIFVFSISLVYLVALKIRLSDSSIAWKLHRTTGVYLLLMIPAHLLFMHLEPALAHEAITVINRMQHGFVKFMDLTLVLGVSYHSGYGLISICKDYLPAGSLQNSLTFLIALTLAVLGWIGMKLTIII